MVRGARNTQLNDDEGDDPGDSQAVRRPSRSNRHSTAADDVNSSNNGVEATAGASQSLPAAAQAAWQSLTEAERREKVNEVVHFIVTANQSGHIIKRTDITKYILKEQLSKAFPVIIEEACEVLSSVFGFQLFENDERLGQYLVANTLQIDSSKHNLLNYSDKQFGNDGLLLAILSAIFMNAQSMTETALWKFLGKMGIAEKDPNNELFGSVKSLISTEWVRSGYLTMTRIPNSDPAEREVRWGPRAEAEVNKRNVLRFVSNIVYQNAVEDWPEQLKRIEEEATASRS